VLRYGLFYGAANDGLMIGMLKFLPSAALGVPGRNRTLPASQTCKRARLTIRTAQSRSDG
jgi:hypothetical protein